MGGPGGGDGDVVEDVAREETAVLQARPYPLAELFLINLLQVVVVVVYIATLGFLKAQQQAQQGGLSTAGGAHDAHVFASL